jgi:hypothetical protein
VSSASERDTQSELGSPFTDKDTETAEWLAELERERAPQLYDLPIFGWAWREDAAELERP